MRVIQRIWRNERKIRQSAVCEIGRKLRKRNQIARLAGTNDVGKICKRIVVLQIRTGISSEISHARQPFGVAAPGLFGFHQLAHNVVIGDHAAERVVDGLDLPRREHEVVADGRMNIGIIASGKPIFGGLAAEADKANRDLVAQR